MGLFYAKRILFGFAIVLLQRYPVIQLICLVLVSLAILVNVAEFKPLLGHFFNRLELYSNICTMLLAYILYSMTDYTTGIAPRGVMGWVIVLLTLQFFTINLYLVAITPVKWLKINWRRCYATKARQEK